MKKDVFYKAIGRIDDDIVANAAMPIKAPIKRNWMKYSAAAACLCLAVLVSIFSLPHLFDNRVPTSPNIPEDAIAKDSRIGFDNKQYVPLSGDLLKKYGFEETVSQSQIGAKLGTVTEGNDTGKEVYAYIPAGSDAVVAMKDGDSYKLYSFFTFKSYENNQDEDMIEYLKVYGIHAYTDIKKVTIDGKELEPDEIETFYNYFSALKNSSDAYFDSLFNGKESSSTIAPDIAPNDKPGLAPDIAPNVNSGLAPDSGYQTDLPVMDEPQVPPVSNEVTLNEQASDTPGAVPGSSGSMGSDALANSHSIVVYGQNGLSFEMKYYPSIEFISRHKVDSDFQSFLKEHLE